jgi:glycosyltransferase involved in cell wall biosynthesis
MRGVQIVRDAVQLESRAPFASARRPRVLFIGSEYAGLKTRFANLERHSREDPRIAPTYRRVTGWKPDGAVERLPLLPQGLKGRVRALLEGSAFAALPRPDVIWACVGAEVTPYLWAQSGVLRRPLILDLDGTPLQYEQVVSLYAGRPARVGVRMAVSTLLWQAVLRTASLFTPWSRWAADALESEGVPRDRIRVLPPGVDLERWRPRPRAGDDTGAERRKLRLLFVGGDFNRKGGDLLLEVFDKHFAERCELDIVTRQAVTPRPGVRVHRAEPNAPALVELYSAADLFVLPTRAEFYGLAAVEALASGLPVIMGNVGAAREIVDHEKTGWLVEPAVDALVGALEHALACRSRLQTMGKQARTIAEQRFDGRRNDALVVEMLLAEAERWRRPTRSR